MKKTLLSLITGTVIGAGSLLPNISQAQFTGTIIDQNCVTNPAMKIDRTGTEHLVWSTGSQLLYANSSDDFVKKTIVSSELGNYTYPSLEIDSNRIVHASFNVDNTTYYANSNGWNLIPLNMGGDTTDLKIDKNNKIYIASTFFTLSPVTSDICIASSNDFLNFSYNTINKMGIQEHPKIALDSKNNIGLVYWDWSDGVINGTGQYKTRFRSSLDNFVSESTVSTAPQSYGASLSVDSKDNFWVSFKDSTYSTEGFNIGDIFLADMNSGWNKQRITVNSANWMQDRDTSLALDSLDNKHLSWGEWNDTNTQVDIEYTNSKDFLNIQVADVGYIKGLGYTSIDTFNDKPTISANLHSLVNFTIIPEPSTLPLLTIAGLGVGAYALRKKW